MQYNRLTSESAIIDYIKRLEKDVKRLANRGSGTIIITDPNSGVETIIGELPDGTTGIQPFVGDVEPPPVASVPIVNSAPGIISVTWDGLFDNNELKPHDFLHLNIIGHKLDGVNTVASAVIGKVSKSDVIIYFSSDTIPVGETWNFSFESEDYNGNKALESIRSTSITMQSLATDTAVDTALQDLQDSANAAQQAATDAQTAANTAQQAADDAAQAALDAANLADTKGKTIIQSAEPAVADRLIQNLWIDTTNGANTPKRWNGSAWVAITDKVAIDAANAAVNAQTTADQAYNQAVSAATAAGNAQTTADTKNRVWYQTTPPTGTSHKTGDTWFDTDDGNKIYLWTGSAWTAFQDAAIAAAQGTANTALTSANGKNKNYYQTTQPTGGTYLIGDNWFDTDDNYKLYVYTGSTWQLAQDSAGALSTAIATEASKGTDLVINGTGYLGNNTNFSTLTFDATDAPIGATGSFTTDTFSTIKQSDSLMTIDPNKKYITSIAIRQQVNGIASKAYAGLAVYDAQGNIISVYQYAYDLAKETTLSAPLNPGSTTVSLTSTAGWDATATTNFWMIGFWNWADPTGKIWPKNTYTRNTAYYNSTSVTATTITLSSPYAGPALPAGTPVSQMRSGGNYLYTTASNVTPANTWTTYRSGVITGLHNGANGAATFSFPVPTAAVKILILANRDVAGGRHAFSGVSLSDATAAQVTADSKIKTFVQSTTPIATTIGDIWIDTANGNTIKTWEGSSWINRADAAIAAAQGTANTALTSANGKNKNYYQTTQPTGGTYLIGDNWFDTDDNYKLYVYTGSTWQLAQDSASAQSTANTANSTANTALSTANLKTKTYFQTAQPGTTGNTTGDIWFDTDDGNKVYVWNGTAWTVAQDAAIATAQSAANNKNKIYYQTAQPTGGTYLTGDTWFDTDDGNKIYVYNGSSWVASELGTNALANLAITDAKIATGTITNAKIANLDAGKITTGTLDANRIGANTITATHIASNAITADELAANSITAAKGQISDAAITTAKIADAQITNAKIADLAVTNAKIADATIQAAKIGSVDAGTITVGTLSADRIGSNTITASKIAVTDFTNLIDNGRFNIGTDGLTGWNSGSGTVVSDVGVPSGKALKIDGNGGYPARYQTRQIPAVVGNKYRLKALLMRTSTTTGTSPITIRVMFRDVAGTIVTNGNVGVAVTMTSPNIWYSINGIVTAPAGTVTAQFWVEVNTQAPIGSSAYISEFQAFNMNAGELIVDGTIQAGSAIIATGAIGTAQIGDAQITSAKIADAQITTAKIVDLAVTDAKISTINAGKIVAGFIDAARIQAGSIIADKLFVGSGSNLIPDPSFANTEITASRASRSTGTWTKTVDATGNIVMQTSVATSGSWYYSPVTSSSASNTASMLPVVTGENYSLRVTVDTGTSSARVRWNAYLHKKDGTVSYVGIGALPYGTGKRLIDVNYVIPVDVIAWYPQITTYDPITDFKIYGDAQVILRAQGHLVVDGAITTSHMTAGTIDASILTAGSITAPKIASKTIGTDKLVISSSDNLILEADFSNSGSSWELGTNKTIVSTAGRGSLPAYRVTGTTVQQTSKNLVNKIPVGSEDRFRCSMWIKSTAALAIDKVRIMVRCYTTATAYTDIIGMYNTEPLIADTWTNIAGISEILPANTIAVEFYTSVINDLTTTITDIDYVAVTRAADGKLIVDGTVTASKLESQLILASEIIGGNPLGNHAKMDSLGFKVLAPVDGGDPAEVVRLGIGTEDYLGILGGTGEIVAGINSVGDVTAQNLDVANTITVGGDNLMARINAMPRGMAAWGQVAINSNMSSNGEVGLFEIGWDTSQDNPARMYQFNVNQFIINQTAAGIVGLRLRYTTDGTAPTISSPLIGYSYFYSGSAGVSTTGSFTRIIGSNNGPYIRVLLSLYDSTSGIAEVWSGTGQSHLYCTVMDLGETLDATASATTGGGTPYTGSTVSAPTNPVVTKTVEYAHNGVRSYTGGNAWYNYNTAKGYQGLSPAGIGNLKSVWTFPSITTLLSGATVNEIWAYFYFEHWYYGAGGTARIMVHGHTGVPSTYSASALAVTSGSWPRGAGRWVKIPSTYYAGFKSGTYRGFALEGDGTYNTYGIANASRIRIKYTK